MCRKYQCHHTNTHLGQMHPKETPTCSVALRSFHYLCAVENTWRCNQKQLRQNADRMVYDTLVSAHFLGARETFLNAPLGHCETLGRAQAQSIQESLSCLKKMSWYQCILYHSVCILSMQFPCLPHISPSCFLHVQPGPDRYNLQACNGCEYCAYFGRYGRNLKALQHLLVTSAKKET